MISGFDPGALLGTSYQLADGIRVRLRLVSPGDGPRVRDLLAACGCRDRDLAAERLLRFDPRTRVVVCATTLIDGTEEMVAVGAIELDPKATQPPIPNPLVIDEYAPPGVADLLAGALLGRAHALNRRRAA